MNLPENDQGWLAAHVRGALLQGSLNEQEHVSGSNVQSPCTGLYPACVQRGMGPLTLPGSRRRGCPCCHRSSR